MNPFAANLQAHMARQARAVGGPYGRRAAPQLGWAPSANVVHFDGGTVLKEDDPTANFYSATNALQLKDRYTYNGDDTTPTAVQHQGVLKFERPIDRIRFLAIPISASITQPENLSGGISQQSMWSVNSMPSGNFHSDMDISLIRVPLYNDPDPLPSGMDANPWALNKLTWNNSYYTTLHMPAGTSTLFATATNIETFTTPKIAGDAAGEWAHLTSNSYSGMVLNTCASMWFEGLTQEALDKANNGPFYGVHIRFNTQYKGGFPSDPPASGVESAWCWLDTQIDLNTTANYRLGFAVGDDLDVLHR